MYREATPNKSNGCLGVLIAPSQDEIPRFRIS